MIRHTIESILQTTRALIRDLSSVAIFAGLYAVLLATLYGFIATREATVWQVLLTLLFVATAPLIFFLLQAAIINHARTGQTEWARTLRDSTKLALISLPVILVGVGVMWLLNRWQAHFPTPYFNPRAISGTVVQAGPTPPFHWPTVLFGTLRALIFVILLPLALVHLWIEVAGQNLFALFHGGARAFLARTGQLLTRAWSSQSVVSYSLGLVLFGLIPYVLLFVHIPVKGAWSEISVFTTRLVLVYLFTLLGWVITLSTLAHSSDSQLPPTPEPVVGDTNPTRSESVVEPEMSVV